MSDVNNLKENGCLYELKDGYSFKKGTQGNQSAGHSMREVELQAKFMLREYDATDLLILKALYKYQWLNAFNIEKYLNAKLKNKLQKPTYQSNIKKLVRQGAVEAVRYCDNEHPKANEPELVIYCLPPGSYLYIRNTYSQLPVTYRYEERDYNIAENITDSDIMERLSLNQWHIEMLSKFKENIKEERYFERIKCGTKKEKFLSYISIKSSADRWRSKITFAAIPGAKTESSIKKMEFYLAKACKALQESSRENAFSVITCSSLAQMTEINKRIRDDRLQLDIMPVYVLDRNTANGTQMNAIYACMNTDETEVLETYSLTL